MENKKESIPESAEEGQTRWRNDKGRAPRVASARKEGSRAGGEAKAETGKAGRPAAQAKEKEKESKLRVIHLGGLGEIGKNMMLIQYGENIIVIDGGVMFPEDELLGIDMVIPDYTYLLENRHMLRAFLLTHGHEDHIGAMPYILKDLQAPVYGSRLTLGLLKGKLNEHRVSAETHEVKPRQVVNIGPFSVEFIRLAHSIPGSLGVAVHTPVGTIMVISDFKMDMSPIDGELTDFGRISRLGEEGVLLLLADSTNVEKPGFTPSEKTVGETFDKIFLSTKGRIIITSFASNVHRIQQAIWSAEKFGRKVAVVGRGMANVTAIAKDLGYLEIPKDILIDVDEVNDLPAQKVLILTTGSQGEPLSGLTRMSMGEHKQVHIMPGDLVIISATAIPGNERLVGRTIDNLFRQGAMVIHEKSDGIHVSGHASKEELKVLLNMVKPRFFMPMHGEYRMLFKHARLAQQLGMSENDIFVLENGQVLDVTRRRCMIDGSVPSGRILIDGLGVGDVGNTVLKDRRLLSQGGIVVVNIVVDKKSGALLSGPEFFSRGFIFEKEYEHIISEVREKTAAICAQGKSKEERDWQAVRGQIRNTVAKTLFDRTGRRPIVLPLLTEV
ncbi:MAG: ribonuclease J [Clostridiales bacterium]|nr:ribonuclease J [Clostridiales bacterium]